MGEVRDLKILLKDLDDSNDTVLLKTSLDKMKDLMIETLEALKEARGNYNSALETFENLNSSIGKQNRKLEKMLTKNSAEYEDWTQKTRGGVYGTIGTTTTACIIADALVALGICSAISLATGGIAAIVTEVEIAEYAEKLDLINNWNNSAEVVNKNIDKYPKEYLEKYISIRTIFVNGLDDLNKSAEDFLAQPIDILA